MVNGKGIGMTLALCPRFPRHADNSKKRAGALSGSALSGVPVGRAAPFGSALAEGATSHPARARSGRGFP